MAPPKKAARGERLNRKGKGVHRLSDQVPGIDSQSQRPVDVTDLSSIECQTQ